MLNIEFFNYRIPFDIIAIVLFIAQFILVAIWYIDKLRRPELKEIEFMKLEYYATFAVFILTIIWIIYDVSKITWLFAFAMTEFIFLQLMIKYSQIKRKEKEDNFIERE